MREKLGPQKKVCDMIVKMSFMVLLNFLRVNTQVTGISTSSKYTLSTANHFEGKLKASTIPPTNTQAKLSKYQLIDESTTSSINSSILETTTVENVNQHILTILTNYIETWLTKEANTSQSTAQLYNQLSPNIDPITNTNPPSNQLLLPMLGDVTFFQLWKEIGTKNNGNFTLKNTPTEEHNSYYKSNPMNRDRYNIAQRWDYDTPQMKAILVKDTRYRSLMKKWITNRRRHGRRPRLDGNFSAISNNSSRFEMSNLTSGCESCPNNTSDDEIIKSKMTCVRDNNATSCNASSNADDKSSANDHDHDDPEARFYDPLMPYPEEYPEEYQTIQNGPALIISRTTYTRIPNVTYTTITMVTLPTYRLVEKAENAFAATLFDEEPSSKPSTHFQTKDRCAHCDKNSNHSDGKLK